MTSSVVNRRSVQLWERGIIGAERTTFECAEWFTWVPPHPGPKLIAWQYVGQRPGIVDSYRYEGVECFRSSMCSQVQEA